MAEISYGLAVALSTPAFTVSPFEVTLALIEPSLFHAGSQGGLPGGIGHARFRLVVRRVDGDGGCRITRRSGRAIGVIAGAAETDKSGR